MKCKEPTAAEKRVIYDAVIVMRQDLVAVIPAGKRQLELQILTLEAMLRAVRA